MQVTRFMLEVSDLECRRGDRLLFSGLSFTLEPGTLLHVRGRNGSGKTTLLRALCGLLTPDAERTRAAWEMISMPIPSTSGT